MIAIIKGGDVLEDIDKIIKYAEDNTIPLEIMEKGVITESPLPESSMLRIHPYTIAYTHEEQPGNIICRHLSISTCEPDKLPDANITVMMMVFFRFVNSLAELKKKKTAWVDKNNKPKVINMVEPVSGNFNELQLRTIH